MAGKSRRVIRAYVLDTSYLLEIYQVPGHSDEASIHAIRQKLRQAIEADARLYVPYPVIFELANHIAHVADGGRRISLARKLADDIRNSAQEGNPWIIVPAPDQSVLLELSGLLEWMDEFESDYAAQGLGLSDLAVTKQADALSRRYPEFAVHIWTKDNSLKAREPQKEPDVYVGT
jgi:rRNA-processing protein FCF1